MMKQNNAGLNPEKLLHKVGEVEMSNGQIVPLMEIKWMTDEQWRELTETPENRAKLAAAGYRKGMIY